MLNNAAIVVKIYKTVEIPGADNIHLAYVLGESVIVRNNNQIS